MEFLKSNKIKILISILWGLGLACIFRQSCKGRNCIIYKAPNPNIIKDKVYMFDNKCYKYNTVPTTCSKDVIDV